LSAGKTADKKSTHSGKTLVLVPIGGSEKVWMEEKTKGVRSSMVSKQTGGLNGSIYQYEGAFGIRGPLRTPNKTLEPENETLYIWITKWYPHHRSSKNGESF